MLSELAERERGGSEGRLGLGGEGGLERQASVSGCIARGGTREEQRMKRISTSHVDYLVL